MVETIELVDIKKVADCIGIPANNIAKNSSREGISPYILTKNKIKKYYLSIEDAKKIMSRRRKTCNLNADINLYGCVFYEEIPSLLERTRTQVRVYIENARIESKWTWGRDRFFPRDDYDRIKNAFGKLRRNFETARSYVKTYYKVAVYDEDLFGWVVKKCSLSKNKAKMLTDTYIKNGLNARYSPHIKERN